MPTKEDFLPVTATNGSSSGSQCGVILTDGCGKAWSNVKYELSVGNNTKTGRTGADGLVKVFFPQDITEATLHFWPYPNIPQARVTKILHANSLADISTVEGKKGRLINQSYFCGTDLYSECEQTEAAIRQFQYWYDQNVSGLFDSGTLSSLQKEEEMSLNVKRSVICVKNYNG